MHKVGELYIIVRKGYGMKNGFIGILNNTKNGSAYPYHISHFTLDENLTWRHYRAIPLSKLYKLFYG